MKQLLLLIIIFTLFLTPSSGQNSKITNRENPAQINQSNLDEKQLENLKQRFSVKYASIFASSLWTLTHNYKSKAEVDDVMNFLQKFFAALQSNDKVQLREIGGAKGFKDKFSEFLKSEDDTVKGFAAITLGIAGDPAYAPPIAVFLDERDKSFTEQFVYPLVVYRGQAATALGIMAAKEYTPKIALLLKSQNDYDRSGAISALSYLGAKEYSKEIADLLTNKDFQNTGDVSPIYFLIETGSAKDYKKELVEIMLGSLRSETAETAVYAFVRLESKENAKDIAKLLSTEFRKGSAAKALALLDAAKYEDEIAALLSDENGLVRKDALLSLGILKAKNYAGKAAELLNNEKDYIRYYAAVALVLMGAKEYYQTAIPIIEKSHQSRAYLNEGDFHPLISERSRKIIADFKELLEQAKASSWHK
jgi:HEAT repeat protein